MSRSSGRKDENSSNEVDSVVPVSSASADSKPAAVNHESGSAQAGEQRKRSRFSLNRLWRYSAGDHRPTDKLDTHAAEENGNGKPAKRRSIRLDLFGRRNKTDQPTTTQSLDLPATETAQAAERAAARSRQASKQRHQEAGLSRSARETRAVLAPSSPSRSHNARHQQHHPRDQRGGGARDEKTKKRRAVEGLDLAVAREHRGVSGSASARGASSRIGGDKERRERRADNSEGGKSRPDKGEGRSGSRIDRDRDRDRAKGDAEKKGAERESKKSRTPREAKDSKERKEANNNREQLHGSSRDVRDKDRDARERKPSRDDKEKEKEGKRERERDSREQRKQERGSGGDKDKQRERRGTDSKDEKKERHRGRDPERDLKKREKEEKERRADRNGREKEKKGTDKEKEVKRAASTTKGAPEAAAPAAVAAEASRPVSQRAEAGVSRERSGSLRRRSRRPDDDKDRCTPQDRAAKDEHPARDHDKAEEKEEKEKPEGKAQAKPRRNTTSAKKDDDGDKEADRGHGAAGCEGADTAPVKSNDAGQEGGVVGDNGSGQTDKKDPEPVEEGSSIDESPFARELAKRANQNREQKLTQMEQMLATKKTKGSQRPKRSTPAAGTPKKPA